MSNASTSFLLFAAAVILLTNLSQRLAWRQTVLLAASAAFLWMCGGAPLLLPLLGFVALGYAGLKTIESGWGRWLAPLVVFTVLLYVWLKKYTFLPASVFLDHPYSTLGLSYILFRIIHLMTDGANQTLPDRVGPVSYLAYTLNFTTLVAGPIQRYQDFHKSWTESKRLSIVRAGGAIERIITGFFKTTVMASIFSSIQRSAIAQIAAHDMPSRVLAGAVTIGAYPFFLYCNFSGYIDIVIGIARLIHIDLPENFDRPFSADSFIGFWSRWHITLSGWLKSYVYNPLLMGLMRRFPAESLITIWAVSAYFLTFFLIGVWHGRTSSFLFFGVLQGLGVSINKLYEIMLTRQLGRKRTKALTSNSLYIAIARGLTFTWFAFTLIWFWTEWPQIGSFERAMGCPAILGALVLLLLASTIGLAAWESARAVLLGLKWGNTLLRSRYSRTAWCTAMALITIAAGLLLTNGAPEIVYKAF